MGRKTSSTSNREGIQHKRGKSRRSESGGGGTQSFVDMLTLPDRVRTCEYNRRRSVKHELHTYVYRGGLETIREVVSWGT